MQMVDGIDAQIQQVFLNLKAVATASGGSLNDIVKLNIYLTDLDNFALVNEIMAGYFSQPYPARAAVGVKSVAAWRFGRNGCSHGAVLINPYFID
jgi:enamine deaminase RidA (YjgF/YER057c/UK114 family)